MSEWTTGMATLCRRCGQAATGRSANCPHCGSPLAAAAGPAARGPAPGPPISPAPAPAFTPAPGPAPVSQAGLTTYRFEPARIASGPLLRRKGWLAVGVAGAVVVLGLAAFLVFRPAPPSPSGTVRDYFADLGRDDTAAALALVDTGGAGGSGFPPGSAPLLVPAALANAANRPTDAKVTSSKAATGVAGNTFTAVTVTYKVGGHSVDQLFGVFATGDKKTPYRLEEPFMVVTVEAPDGLAVKVNGIAVGADTLAEGTPAFPGAYQATTTGNALFAGATKAATYQAAGNSDRADIAFGQPALAPGAQQAVQAAAQQSLDTNCVNTPVDLYNYDCPLQAPDESFDQTTTWKITTYPQVQLSAAGFGQAGVRFSTGTQGSANYTITYTDFDGTTKTQAGTVPIDISGSARIGDNGGIQITID
jgi:hypothetical protein